MTYKWLTAIFIIIGILVALVGYRLPRQRGSYREGEITGYTFACYTAGVILAVAGGGITYGVGAAEDYNQRQCENTLHDQTGLPTHYERWHGCFITVDGKTIPYDKWINNTPTD